MHVKYGVLDHLWLYIYYTYYTLFNICSDQQKLNYTEIKNISHEPLFSLSLSLYRSLLLSSFLYLFLSIIFSLSLDLQNSFKYFYAFCCVCVCWYNTIVCTFVHKIVWLCVQLCVRLCTKLCGCVYRKDGPCQIPRLILMLSSWALSVSWPHPLRFYQMDSWSLFLFISNNRYIINRPTNALFVTIYESTCMLQSKSLISQRIIVLANESSIFWLTNETLGVYSISLNFRNCYNYWSIIDNLLLH